ncbi:MAG TPA: GNAT family N-acetyltransferase [Saprospiraceae bacterium]|nr:GNAT family N-acetyltransferase [Saprospiraceae bacterium]HQW26409.1 GNAT family N-acetyltransferase [Saprospiraceae bacterium]
MGISNFERMLQLADDVFAVKNDPDQLDVNQDVLDQLRRIHPATVSEFDDGHGPVAWVLLIPTTLGLMDQFLSHSISEKELYEQTPLDASYEAIYLCSAMVLEEYRRKGIARQLTLKAIDSIRKDHPIKNLFVWSFTIEGDMTADTISQITSLPLLKRL